MGRSNLFFTVLAAACFCWRAEHRTTFLRFNFCIFWRTWTWFERCLWLFTPLLSSTSQHHVQSLFSHHHYRERNMAIVFSQHYHRRCNGFIIGSGSWRVISSKYHRVCSALTYIDIISQHCLYFHNCLSGRHPRNIAIGKYHWQGVGMAGKSIRLGSFKETEN